MGIGLLVGEANYFFGKFKKNNNMIRKIKGRQGGRSSKKARRDIKERRSPRGSTIGSSVNKRKPARRFSTMSRFINNNFSKERKRSFRVFSVAP